MSETQVLLSRIAALRRQLEQVQGLTKDTPATDASASKQDSTDEDGVRRLERQMAEASQHTVFLDTALRQLTPDPLTLPSPPAAGGEGRVRGSAKEPAPLPKQLTFRARRILEQGRKLLGQLRSLADEFEPAPSAPLTLPSPPAAAGEGRVRGEGTQTSGERPQPDRNDPLTQRYQEAAAMANTALRMIQAFPDAASVQLSLCQGLEAILAVVAERIAGLMTVVEQRRREAAHVELLAGFLTALAAKAPVNIQPVVHLAEQLLAEAQQAAPLRFRYASPDSLTLPSPPAPGGEGRVRGPAQFVASHSVTVARVVARVVRQDPDFRSDPLGPILAALLHDAGMLSVPASILLQPGPLDDAQRRTVEGHTRSGAELLMRLLPDGTWLAEVAAAHHERLDGTGYPAGRQEAQLDSLTRLVAVCDVYAALCTPRPHRPALDTRTALADTLLLAEQGALDRYHAERLLRLSFYPLGSVVELADGALGVVIATHMGRRDLTAPARPVLAVLTDTQGRGLPTPQYLDLAECDHRSIVRTVGQAERSTLLGSRYPELL